MATTLQIIDAVVARLKVKLPQLAVEYFPDQPGEYRLNHSKGALLVSYPGSQFTDPVDLTCIVQPRVVKLSITVLLRQLNGRGGAIEKVDEVRRALVGWRPMDCRKTWAVSEKFLGESAGIWQYAVDLATQTMLVEDSNMPSGPILNQVTHEETP
ncbi:Gp37 family protein [Leeia aquatica]|uniref:Gp37 protein n=1 Tax=Leeia aquatica TaxID=2725557 RepID=A0A847S8B2_9NEIS|nr:Gp37 family protein [Leeia aquatica]NLR73579.1 hypothetical protein [Leeia aquatica]